MERHNMFEQIAQNLGGVVDTNEIRKLRAMLEEAGIPHTFEERNGSGEYYGAQIRYPVDDPEKCILSAITIGFKDCPFSYGGEAGLIEIMGLLTEDEQKYSSVLGWLTAEDVFGRIKAHWIKNGGFEE